MGGFNEEKSKLARSLFVDKGYNCSQAVLCAYADDLGLDMDTAKMISSSFGGGMGRLREVCGTVSGAFMVLGLKYGNYNTKNVQEKAEHYKRIQDFARRFKEENNYDSIICRELLGLGGASEPTPEKRTNAYYKRRPCSELVALSAGLLGEFI